MLGGNEPRAGEGVVYMDPISPPPLEPEQARRRSFGRLPRAALAGGIAAGVALGGAGIAFAASSATTPTTKPSTPAKPSTPSTPKKSQFHGRGRMFAPRFGAALPGFGLGRVVHGQFTVPQGSGYKTVEVQVGTASSVSPSSITVTSADHYRHTYTVTSATVVDAQRDGISSVKNGDQVRILATTSKGADVAASITDTTKLGASGKQFGFPFAPGQPQGQPPAAAG
jgi:hypothetical protein